MNTATTTANRSCTWSDNDVKTLIAIWGERKVQEELDGSVRNRTVYVNIAKKMNDLGYDRDWQQCKVKINIKKSYREVKDHNGETGQSRKSCKHYKELDEILEHRPASVPAVLLDTGCTSQSSNLSQDSAEEGETSGNVYVFFFLINIGS